MSVGIRSGVGLDVSSGQLRSFFQPRHVVMVGASDRSRWSRTVFANLTEHSPGVHLDLISPRNAVVHGAQTHRSVTELDTVPDLAYVMTPAHATAAAVQEAAEAGVSNFVILSAGFDESDPELARSLAQIQRAHSLRILGPNASGFVNVAGGVAPYGLTIPAPLLSGGVTLIIQSGGLLGSSLHAARARGMGVNLLCALGNETFIGAEDVIGHAVIDEATRVIAVFLETIRRPEDFKAAASAALHAGKPVVVMKAGRSAAGSRAALSHTGALAGDDAIIDAAFDGLGVIRTDSIEELLAVSALLERHGGCTGRRVAIVSASGGQNNIAADACEAYGLESPDLSAELASRLRPLLPAYAVAQNPLDVTGAAVNDPPLLTATLSTIGTEGTSEFDWLAHGVFLPALLASSEPGGRANLDAAQDAHAASHLPVVVHTSVAMDIAAEDALALRERGIVVLSGTDLAMRAIARASDYGQTRTRLLQPDPAAGNAAAQPVTWPEGATAALSEWQARSMLQRFGVPFPPAALARSREEAAAAAHQIGTSVVLKVCAPELLHKTEAGGVLVGVSAADGADAFDRLLAQVREHAPHIGPDGVIVAEQVPGGLEMIVGAVRDAAWGSFLVIGLGGVWVEVMNDVVRVALPTTRHHIHAALQRLRCYRLLGGFRGTAPLDVEALLSAIEALAEFTVAAGAQLESVELNPVRVTAHGVYALDALITRKGAQP